MIAPWLPDQYRLAERRSSFEECFVVCDEQVGDWQDDARLGAGVVEIRRPRQRLAVGLYSHGVCQKLWVDPRMRMVKHAYGMAWRTLRFGWRGRGFLASSASSFVTL